MIQNAFTRRFAAGATVLLTLLVLGLAAERVAAAVTASSDIQGFMKLTCLGKSDTILSTPLARAAVYAGAGTGATVTAGVKGTITFTGTPFTASQFKYAAGTQANSYYAFVASGTKEGDYFVITDNTTSSVTVDLNGDSVAEISGATVKIIPFWTLGTLFPSGAGITASSDFTVGTQVLLPDTTSSGVNLAAQAVYYYSSATGHWQTSNSASSQDDVVLYPDNYLTVRNNTAADTTVTVTGTAMVSKLMVPLATSAATKQDNFVAVQAPVSLTLNDSGLISSGAFKASSDFTTTDQLFVFDNTVAELNKAATRIYYYANGAWRRSGVSGDVGTDVVFTPGTGVLIRKAVDAGSATSMWTAPATTVN